MLDWPSSTVEWFPDIEDLNDGNNSVQRVCLGTNVSDQETNYLIISRVILPGQTIVPDSRSDKDDEIGGYNGPKTDICIDQKIIHEGEVNKARYMPQNPCLIATRTSKGSVLIFDYTKHRSFPDHDDTECRFDLRLIGQNGDGYGLGWNKLTQGYICSGSYDHTVTVWDINRGTQEYKLIEPLIVFRGHNSPVNDVEWHPSSPNILGSVGDDCRILLWDLNDDTRPCNQVENAHKKDILSISFNPYNEFVICTGSADQTVSLWDTRRLEYPTHKMKGHTAEIQKVCWSTFKETILGSCSVDKRVIIWDCDRIGMKQDEEDAKDGPPELLFVHGGHIDQVTDISWNPNDPWTMTSVAGDNMIHIWKPAESVYDSSDDE